jgi:hypothetical protein
MRNLHDCVDVADHPGPTHLPVRINLADAAVDRSVPSRLRRSIERERSPLLEPEPNHRQKPFGQQRRVGQGAPDLLRRMSQVEIEP